MAETSGNWVNLCLTDVRKYVSDTFEDESKESMIPALYSMATADGQEEYDVSYSGIGKFQLFTGTAPKDKMTEEYKKTYDFPEYMNEIDIQRKLWDDRKDRQVMNMSKEFGMSAYRTKEGQGAEIFNNAFTASGTYSGGGSSAGPDTLALCSHSHTSKADSGYTGDNLIHSSISTSAIGEMRDLMRKWTDGRGNKVPAKMDMILIAADKDVEEVAWEIINSSGKVDTADNNKNFYSGRFKLAVWDELTALNRFFGIDSKRMKLHMTWFTRVPFETYDSFNDSTQTLTFGGYMRHGMGYNSWRFIVGSDASA
jgi:hypothetical protein